MTAGEIQLLRQKAENERNRHAQMMHLIHSVEIGAAPPLSIAYQMEIVSREREDETLALLKVYVEKFGQDTGVFLSDAAQLYIYDDKNKLPQSKKYMLHSMPLCYSVERRIFDDDKPLYYQETDGVKEFYPKFSPEGEEHMVEGTMENCNKAKIVTDELYFLRGYTKEHRLSPQGEVALMKFLSSSDRSAVLDALENFVIEYLAQYKELCPAAQIDMIKSDDHKVIMYYITQSLDGIKDDEVVEALLNRAEREEVTAYFERYAKES